jgi:hypothetical protein
MKNIFIIAFLFFFFGSTNINAQRNNQVSPYQEFLNELSEYRKLCRNALKPYRYDGSKTTHFSYKEYNYAKEVEIGTVQNSEYRLSFNSNGIRYDNIKVQIYDKSKNYKSRMLLYEKDGVGQNEFTVETGPMLEQLKENKLLLLNEKYDKLIGTAEVDAKYKHLSTEQHLKNLNDRKKVDEKIISKMRLKRLYINYIIPAIDREIEVDEITGNEVRVVTKGAIVLAIGYSNL